MLDTHSKITIVVADDHPLFRSAIQQSITQNIENSSCLEAESATELYRLLEQSATPDLVLLDLQMPGAHGFSTLIQLRSQYAEVPVVVISAHEEDLVIQQSLDHGAAGFIPKSSPIETIRDAVKLVLQGEIYLPENYTPREDTTQSAEAERLASLTPQQYRVLTMFAEGLLNKQIAYELGVSEATIKAHATAIFRKLGVRNRTQAVIALTHMELEQSPISA